MPQSPVVLDTNIFVAAGFNRKSTSAKIMNAVKQGQVRMVWNDATRREIEYIMRRIPPLRAHAIAELFRPEDHFAAATQPEHFAAIPDPDDRKFAALAQAAGAILVSNDDHLLQHQTGLELTVLTPAAFWKRHSRADQASGDV